MPDALNKESRERIAVFLPDALEKALTSYHKFMSQDIPEEAKDFSAYHGAAKVAISHVELLMKLAKWAPASAEEKGAGMLDVLAKAEQEVRGYKSRQELWEQEGEEYE